jgi:hypothetical protein
MMTVQYPNCSLEEARALRDQLIYGVHYLLIQKNNKVAVEGFFKCLDVQWIPTDYKQYDILIHWEEIEKPDDFQEVVLIDPSEDEEDEEMKKTQIKTKDCRKCKGHGHKTDSDNIQVICPRCDGIGQVCTCCEAPLYACRHN